MLVGIFGFFVSLLGRVRRVGHIRMISSIENNLAIVTLTELERTHANAMPYDVVTFSCNLIRR
jgi:hypothetical protein